MKKYLVYFIIFFFGSFAIYFLLEQVVWTKTFYETIDYEQLEEQKNKNKELVVFFSQAGCHACENVEPIVNEIAKEKKTVKIIINKEKNIDKINQEFNILGTPTIVFIKSKKEYSRIVGLFEKKDLIKKIGGMKIED